MTLDITVGACDNLNLLQANLDKVENLLTKTYTDNILESQVNAMCLHVIKAGGKRIRPRLVLLSALALPNFDIDQDLDNICYIASAIELLHTATLVHDDVIDKAPIRRGQPTLNEMNGNHAAVLAGDYLFTRCFDLLQKSRNFNIITELSKTLRKLVVGELYQLEHQGDVKLSVETYYETIYHKTGVLFELAASAPAVVIPRYTNFINPLKKFGCKLGIAFQIKDDMLDYTADSSVLGKDAGTDLNDQRITLPVLLALQHLEQKDPVQKEELLKAIATAQLEPVRQAIIRTNTMQECEAHAIKACSEAKDALAVLPDSPFKQAMFDLCHKAIQRQN